jgi:predicted ATPase
VPTANRDGGPHLLGRRSECETLDHVVADIRAGVSHALVIRGEAGVGKSALLEYLAATASQCRVLRAAGVESEMELPFAGLHQFCGPILDRLDRLPDPQRDAMSTAFGLQPGESADRFFVGLATLTLLSDFAEERPVLCVVDDAQWLDRASAQALAFVARRLSAEAVALVFAEREPSSELAGVPELTVAGLADDDARAVLEAAVKGPLDRRVRDRIVAETHGNPLALMELPHGLTHSELAGGFGLATGSPLSGEIEASFKRRLRRLPPASRELLLIAAAEPIGDPLTVWRAAELLGVGAHALGPASRSGLVEFDAHV